MALVDAGRKCIADGAQCIVLSCLGMAGLGKNSENLRNTGIGSCTCFCSVCTGTGSVGAYKAGRRPKPPDKSRI